MKKPGMIFVDKFYFSSAVEKSYVEIFGSGIVNSSF